MPERNPETVHSIATDVAVIKNEMTHLKEGMDEIKLSLSNLSVVSRADFEEYKKEIESLYVPRAELAGLIKWWNFATSLIGKSIITAIVGFSLWLAAKAINFHF